MSGYIKLHRGWRDSSIFRGEFSRSDAWIWLIENAAWKPTRARIKGVTVEIGRGELTFAQRFMAEQWGWSKSRVDRFIAELRAEGMIETRSKIGAISGHKAGQGQAILKLCNYDKYQSRDEAERGNGDPKIGATAGQQRGKEEEGEEDKKKEQEGGFAFHGRVVRLNDLDFRRWQKSFPALDLKAELQARDDWLADQPATDQGRWFNSTSSLLAKKQTAAGKANQPVFASPC